MQPILISNAHRLPKTVTLSMIKMSSAGILKPLLKQFSLSSYSCSRKSTWSTHHSFHSYLLQTKAGKPFSIIKQYNMHKYTYPQT
jgi:hypothetical protein